MIGNAFQIVEQVGEHKTKLNRTLAFLQAFNVLVFDARFETVYNLFKRLNKDGVIHVFACESVCRKARDVADGAAKSL